MHVQLRSDDDNRTGGVVDTFTEQVLAEAALLTLQGIRQGLQGAVAFALDGTGFLRVVEEGVDRFLEHALLVAEDDLRSLDLDEPLEAVVADDDATVQVIDVGSGETAAIERDERTEIRRNNRDHLHDHPFGTVDVLGLFEPLDDRQTLEHFGLALLGGLLGHGLAELLRQGDDVDLLEEVVNTLRAHLGDELVRIVIGEVAVLRDAGHDFEVLVLGEEVEFLAAALTRADDHVLLIIDDGLQLLGRHAEQGGNLVRGALEVPDVGDGDGQGDMAHTLPAHLLFGHFDAAPVADDAAVADPLVFSAIAFVILGRTEDLLAEKTVFLRLIGPVVDRFRFQDLAAGPRDDVLRGSQGNADPLEIALDFVLFIVESRHISKMGCQ